jgi:hypothetical protein
MKIHQQSVAEALASIHTTALGLSSDEARRRLQQFGPNRVAPAKRRNRLWALLAEFAQLFSIVLWIAALLAFAVEWQVPGQGMGRLYVRVDEVCLLVKSHSFRGDLTSATGYLATVLAWACGCACQCMGPEGVPRNQTPRFRALAHIGVVAFC